MRLRVHAWAHARTHEYGHVHVTTHDTHVHSRHGRAHVGVHARAHMCMHVFACIDLCRVAQLLASPSSPGDLANRDPIVLLRADLQVNNSFFGANFDEF